MKVRDVRIRGPSRQPPVPLGFGISIHSECFVTLDCTRTSNFWHAATYSPCGVSFVTRFNVDERSVGVAGAKHRICTLLAPSMVHGEAASDFLLHWYLSFERSRIRFMTRRR